MGRRYPNPRLAKIHRNYTVEEVARCFGRHKNTVRAWIKRGLKTIDDRRPTLIHGRDLFEFLSEQRRSGKQPCPLGHLYCVKCRVPRLPVDLRAAYIPLTPTSGNLSGRCQECGTQINRRVALAKIEDIRGSVHITYPQAIQRIREIAEPSLNCDFEKDVETHENAQPR